MTAPRAKWVFGNAALDEDIAVIAARPHSMGGPSLALARLPRISHTK